MPLEPMSEDHKYLIEAYVPLMEKALNLKKFEIKIHEQNNMNHIFHIGVRMGQMYIPYMEIEFNSNGVKFNSITATRDVSRRNVNNKQMLLGMSYGDPSCTPEFLADWLKNCPLMKL